MTHTSTPSTDSNISTTELYFSNKFCSSPEHSPRLVENSSTTLLPTPLQNTNPSSSSPKTIINSSSKPKTSTPHDTNSNNNKESDEIMEELLNSLIEHQSEKEGEIDRSIDEWEKERGKFGGKGFKLRDVVEMLPLPLSLRNEGVKEEREGRGL